MVHSRVIGIHVRQVQCEVLDAEVAVVWNNGYERVVGAGICAVLGSEANGPLDDAACWTDGDGVLVAEVDCRRDYVSRWSRTSAHAARQEIGLHLHQTKLDAVESGWAWNGESATRLVIKKSPEICCAALLAGAAMATAFKQSRRSMLGNSIFAC